MDARRRADVRQVGLFAGWCIAGNGAGAFLCKLSPISCGCSARSDARAADLVLSSGAKRLFTGRVCSNCLLNVSCASDCSGACAYTARR